VKRTHSHIFWRREKNTLPQFLERWKYRKHKYYSVKNNTSSDRQLHQQWITCNLYIIERWYSATTFRLWWQRAVDS
jgi:hypothetical protein